MNKNLGVKSIGIGEIPRRIIAKAVLKITRGDIHNAAGALQLSAGEIAGVETAIYIVQDTFLCNETEAALLVDASNAFNTLNRAAVLHNIRFVCPSLSTTLINVYRAPTQLFVDGESLLSQEGTTQGDPLAKPMYALATVPLIRSLPETAIQVWYADDATALGTISHLRECWDAISEKGKKFGYFANPMKIWLVTQNPSLTEAAKQVFYGTDINITSDGRCHLGVPLLATVPLIRSLPETATQVWYADDATALGTISHS